MALKLWWRSDDVLSRILSSDDGHSTCSDVSVSFKQMLTATQTRQFWDNWYAPTCIWFLLYPRYLFNGIRFTFTLCHGNSSPSAYRYTGTANSSSERHATDRRTDRQTASFHNAPPYGGRGIINCIKWKYYWLQYVYFDYVPIAETITEAILKRLTNCVIFPINKVKRGYMVISQR